MLLCLLQRSYYPVLKVVIDVTFSFTFLLIAVAQKNYRNDNSLQWLNRFDLVLDQSPNLQC
jgi:hypothetical protein